MTVNTFRSTVLLLLALFLSAPCFAHHMAVVVSKQNPAAEMTSEQVRKIFLNETKEWPDGTPIKLVLHRESEDQLITLHRLNGISKQEWQTWFNEHKDSVKVVDSDQDVLSYVESTPGAVGLVRVRSVTGRVKVVRVNGKMPMEKGYLSH
jgi:ABC-type phosphate transport system substrate-binding protein